MTNKGQGVAAELSVAHELAARGCGVAWPVGDNEPYDLIVTGSAGGLYKTQVKSAQRNKHGTYKVDFCYGRTSKTIYKSSQIDMLVARLPYQDDFPDITQPGFYVIPISAIKALKGIFYPPGKGRFPQWVCKHEKWRDKWEEFK